MARIASSPYGVWGDIIGTNRDLLRDGIGRFLAHTREVCGDLDEASLKGHFDRAASTRAEIPRDSKGFLSRLWDVLVVVEDRPGVIAGIAAPLAEKRINIKDIEVLKVREGEGGSLRLAFASQEIARAAVEELRSRGYSARLRE
jgi:prephenate dehydrogenase